MRIGHMGRREACGHVAGTGSRDNKKGPATSDVTGRRSNQLS